MQNRFVFFLLFIATFFGVQYFFGSKPKEKVVAPKEIAQVQKVESTTPNDDAQYYVLENNFQQLVFSTKGGAIVEINLPFETKTNKSVVKEIEFDRTFEKKLERNDRYPQFPYHSAEGMKENTQVGGYYPLLRRSILTSQGTVKRAFPAKYYAFNIVGDGIEELNYEVSDFTNDSITFSANLSGDRRIVKTYSFPKGRQAPYTFDLAVSVEGNAKNLWLGTGVPEVELISGSFTPALKYRTIKKGKSVIEKLKTPSEPIVATSAHPNWISNSNGFFGIIIDPLTEISPGYKATSISGTTVPTRLSLIDAAYKLYPADKYPGYEMYLPLKGNETMKFRIFAGPYQDTTLTSVDSTYANYEEGYNPDYASAQSFHGWFAFISEPFAKFLFFLMKIFYKFTNSWGFSIILLTIVLRIMLYPLNAWSIKSSARMQQVAPQVKAIQEKYKKDPKRAQMEIMHLYRQTGANPFMGCFPLLIQMPFLIGMFDLLKSTFELRGASFIPGWIDNLTAPDRLFCWNYPIFFIGTCFHLLPLLLGAIMFLQQKYTEKLSGNVNKGPMNDQQKQQKMMGNIMIVVFTVLFYHFPSGLNIYWLSSMILGIGQQWLMKNKLKKPTLSTNK